MRGCHEEMAEHQTGPDVLHKQRGKRERKKKLRNWGYKAVSKLRTGEKNSQRKATFDGRIP